MVFVTAATVRPLGFRQGPGEVLDTADLLENCIQMESLGRFSKTFDGCLLRWFLSGLPVEGVSECGRKVVIASTGPGRCRGPMDADGGGLKSTGGFGGSQTARIDALLAVKTVPAGGNGYWFCAVPFPPFRFPRCGTRRHGRVSC